MSQRSHFQLPFIIALIAAGLMLPRVGSSDEPGTRPSNVPTASASISTGAPASQPAGGSRDKLLTEARAHDHRAFAFWTSGKADSALNEEQLALDLFEKSYGSADSPEVARALTGVGTVLLNLQRGDEALPDFKAALAMDQRLSKNQDSNDTALAEESMGWCLYTLNRPQEALPFSQKAVDMMRRVGEKKDDPNLATALQYLGFCLEDMDRNQDALICLRDSLEMKRRLAAGADSVALAQAEDSVAACFKTLGRSGDALPVYRSEWEMRRRICKDQDNTDVASTAEEVAGCLDELGRSEEALPIYRDVLQMRQRLYGGRDCRDVSATLNDLAGCLDYLGRTAEALPMYQAGMEMWKRLCKGQDDVDLATDMNNIAGCIGSLGREEEALPVYQAALQMRQRLADGQDSPDVAESLNSVAGCFDTLGRSADALEMHRAALAMLRRVYKDTDHPDLAEGYSDLAACLFDLEQYQQALTNYQLALAMQRRIYGDQDHPSIAQSNNSVAFSMACLGRAKEALPISRDAVQMAERLKSPDLFRYSSILGTILLYTHDNAGAAKAFEESIDALEQARAALGGDDQDRMAFMRANQYWDPFPGMVVAQLLLKRADTAAEYLDRGRARSLLDILERGERLTDGDLLDPIEKKAALTNDTQQLQLIEQIRTAVNAAANQVRQLTSQISHTRALNSDEGFEQIKRLQPKLDLAYQQYADAHRRKFNLAGRTTFTEATSAAQIQSLVQPHQHMLMYSVMPYGAVLLVVPPPGQPISGVVLRKSDGKTLLSGTEVWKLVGDYRRAVVQRGMTSVRGARLAQSDATTRPQTDTAEEGYQLFHDLIPDSVWQQIKDDQLVYVIPDAAMSGLPLEMLVVQKPESSNARDNVYWLDQGPLLAYGPSAAALLELRRQEPQRGQRTYAHQAVLLGDPVLQRKLAETSPPPPSGALVTGVKSGSIAQGIGLRSDAVIVAYGTFTISSKDQFDGAVDKLELLHFHGKLDQTPKLKFWIDGQMLERELSLDAAPDVAVIDMTSDQVARLTPHQAPQAPVAIAMRDATVTRYGALTPLPGTRLEVQGIHKVLTAGPEVRQNPDPVVVLLGEDATGQRLAEAAKGTRYLHLATHGLVQPGQNAIYSSVVLTQPNVITPQDTGMLTLQDLFDNWWGRLDGTELVVLSACDSQGLDEAGTNARGSEGVFGLPWGFMYAGSPAVVASLWEVQDASTAELMQKFYGDLRTSPQTNKLAAFAAARKELKRDYPEPFFWAPFIYLGDPN